MFLVRALRVVRRISITQCFVYSVRVTTCRSALNSCRVLRERSRAPLIDRAKWNERV
ncbi:hypothetical protein U91I_01948 [alpha proteobacterium U9-1i]|nr:hypothetical protein U91I_01948 [alpha proteobacterium U9-1i]